MSREDRRKLLQPIFRLIDSAILAISTVAVFTFVSLGPATAFPLNVALYCYALCIPLAGMHTLLLTMALDQGVAKGVPNPLSLRAHYLLASLTVVAFYLGTISLFAYLSLPATIAFAVGGSAGYGLLMHSLHPGEHGYRAFVLWGGAVLAFNGAILVVGYLLRHQLAVL
jgi:hypothetical protein